MSPGHILLADDDKDFRLLLKQALIAQGLWVIDVADGQAALAAVQNDVKRDIRVLVSDVDMPKIGGFDLARSVKLLRPRIKTVLVSGDDFAREAASAGCGFLRKPFELETLVATIRLRR